MTTEQWWKSLPPNNTQDQIEIKYLIQIMHNLVSNHLERRFES